jgi:hypothetical protein
MAFEPVAVYNLDGVFVGYGIRNADEGVMKLHSTNLWGETQEDKIDLNEQLGRLNANVDIRAFWPQVQDPDVQAILNEPTFEPLKTSPVEVVDEDNSVFIWHEEPNHEAGTPGIMDQDNSIIIYKTVQTPAPTDVKRRIMKASEIVARARAEEARQSG